MKGHQAGACMDSQKKRSDVAVPHNYLWVSSDHVIVDKGQDSSTPPATANGYDAVDRIVGELGIQVSGTLLVCPGQVTVPIQDVLSLLDFQAQCFKALSDDFHIDPKEVGTGWIDNGNPISPPESTGLDDRSGLSLRGRQGCLQPHSNRSS
jgi:hypothetical protein